MSRGRLANDQRIARIALINDLRARGKSTADICDTIGINKSALGRFIARNRDAGAARPRLNVKIWKPEEIAELVTLRADGAKWQEVGNHFGVSMTAAYSAWRSAGRPGGLKGRPSNKDAYQGRPAVVSAPVERRCLCAPDCLRWFSSTHPGERIRPECRPSWESRA